jgi:hypothetical protein
MKIVITKEKYLDEIKQEFSKAFPYLKLDFKIPEQHTLRTIINRMPDRKLKVGDILVDKPDGEINISENNSIHQLTQKFMEYFGLKTSFYRKSGNIWLEIKLTGDWSLKQQNENGMEMY